MSSKYDLVIIYIHKPSGRIIKIDDYYAGRTVPIFNTNTTFVVHRKSRINIDPEKELYNYGHVWSAGVYIIPDMITAKRIREIELEKIRLDVLEDLWLDVAATIENYRAMYSLNPLIEQLRARDRNTALEINGNYPITVPSFSTKTFEEQDIQDRLTTEGLDELCKRCYIMYSDLANKIKKSETPYETFKQARRSYFYPIFEQTGAELFGDTP